MKRLVERPGCALALASLGGFAAGALLVGFLVWRSETAPKPAVTVIPHTTAPPVAAAVVPEMVDDGGAAIIEGKPAEENPLLTGGQDAPAQIGPDFLAALRERQLTLPIQGIEPKALHDTFDEARGARRHEAIDILAPRNTPVVAVEDGSIARLFFSKAGGITIYQFDPSEQYCYYYAHLERYADGLKERQKISRNQVLGYVGTSGNAPPGTPHLHFAIFRLNEAKRWWEGSAVNPYLVFGP